MFHKIVYSIAHIYIHTYVYVYVCAPTITMNIIVYGSNILIFIPL